MDKGKNSRANSVQWGCFLLTWTLRRVLKHPEATHTGDKVICFLERQDIKGWSHNNKVRIQIKTKLECALCFKCLTAMKVDIPQSNYTLLNSSPNWICFASFTWLSMLHNFPFLTLNFLIFFFFFSETKLCS